jgi:gamma-glutamylcyclotransferase (GGCT)/AIG2-like uncharacterized protein YtfP
VPPANLFVYGTLLDDAQVRAVTGRTFPRRRGELAGHRRVWPRGSYPTVVPDPDASVVGDVLEGLDARTLAALDAYEDAGVLYVRDECVVTCAGQPVRCFVYRSPRPPAGTRPPTSGA